MGAHLNVFTAPLLLILLVSVVGVVILLWLFDGRMLRARKRREQAKLLLVQESAEGRTTAGVTEKRRCVRSTVRSLKKHILALVVGPRCDGCSGFDWVAVIVCLVTKLLLQVINCAFQK